MSPYLYPLAFFAGVLFNLNPSCGSATAVWVSTQKNPKKLALMALIRLLVFIAIGALVGYFGKSLRMPWGILLIIGAAYLLYTALKQVRSGVSGVCSLPGKSSTLPWLLAVIPPPSAYIGLALFFGGFNAPSALDGALTLGMIGLGLTLPVWLFILKPKWRTTWQMRLAHNSKTARTQIIFEFVGVGIMTAVGLAFVFLQNFHRPLLEIIKISNK